MFKPFVPHMLSVRLISLLFVLAAFAALAGCSHPKAVVPATFGKYTASDSAFSCDAPAGWAADSSSSGGVESGVAYTSGDAKISVNSDQAGSFMSDALSSPGSILQSSSPLPASAPPVEKLHAMTGNKFAQDLEGYKEVTTTSQMLSYGDSRITEYTAKDVHGYRATLLNKDRRVSVVCRCSPEEWASLSPAFLRVITSIKAGAGN
ncbi:MAG: hypothetical protein P4L33_06120 [Capsulimonadaceae bacterium]|nr:hypothetical protein [Capsulimonadaceae bacterium]